MQQITGVKRLVFADVLVVLAAFSVVALHCNGIVHNWSDTAAWKQSLVVEVLAFWAVSVFFMLSGMNLLGYRERYDTKSFLIKRAKRTLIPYLVWVLFAFAVEQVRKGAVDGFSVTVLWDALIFQTPPRAGVYWFFMPLFAFYLSVPVLSLLKDNRRVFWYIFWVGTITISVIPMLCKLFGIGWNEQLQLPVGGGYVIFGILGYLLGTQETTRKQRVIVYILAIAGAVFRYSYTYFMSEATGELNRNMFSYLWPNSIALAAAVFLFVKNLSWDWVAKHARIFAVLKELAGCALGVFLFHNYFIAYLLPSLGWHLQDLRFRTLGVLLVFTAATAVTFVMRRIPILRATV